MVTMRRMSPPHQQPSVRRLSRPQVQMQASLATWPLRGASQGPLRSLRRRRQPPREPRGRTSRSCLRLCLRGPRLHRPQDSRHPSMPTRPSAAEVMQVPRMTHGGALPVLSGPPAPPGGVSVWAGSVMRCSLPAMLQRTRRRKALDLRIRVLCSQPGPLWRRHAVPRQTRANPSGAWGGRCLQGARRNSRYSSSPPARASAKQVPRSSPLAGRGWPVPGRRCAQCTVWRGKPVHSWEQGRSPVARPSHVAAGLHQLWAQTSPRKAAEGAVPAPRARARDRERTGQNRVPLCSTGRSQPR